MESHFEAHRWHLAQLALREIGEKIEQLGISDTNQDDFSKIFDSLTTSLNNKDIQTTENNYISLQTMLFRFAEDFAYDIPPILIIMDKYINDEAAQALKNNDLDEVYSEMREVGSFFRIAKKILAKKGVDEESLTHFKKTLVEVQMKCIAKETSLAKSSFTELQKVFGTFLSLYN
jgi:hypothetical protein